MLCFNPYYWSALQFTWTPTFGEFMHIIPHNLLSDEHMWARSCCLTPPHTHTHRLRTGTTGWGAWRMLRCVRERSRPSSPSQLWVAGSLSPYDVIIYLFFTNSYYIVKMWHSFLHHDSSYVWDLVPAHLVNMFTPGSWCPKTRVWHDATAGSCNLHV
jgi:hypothetical protein